MCWPTHLGSTKSGPPFPLGSLPVLPEFWEIKTPSWAPQAGLHLPLSFGTSLLLWTCTNRKKEGAFMLECQCLKTGKGRCNIIISITRCSFLLNGMHLPRFSILHSPQILLDSSKAHQPSWALRVSLLHSCTDPCHSVVSIHAMSPFESPTQKFSCPESMTWALCCYSCIRLPHAFHKYLWSPVGARQYSSCWVQQYS